MAVHLVAFRQHKLDVNFQAAEDAAEDVFEELANACRPRRHARRHVMIHERIGDQLSDAGKVAHRLGIVAPHQRLVCF
jgi:molybdopterin synthase catalytic subunit